eukprot:762704-Hanusia_phi.AAC.2
MLTLLLFAFGFTHLEQGAMAGLAVPRPRGARASGARLRCIAGSYGAPGPSSGVCLSSSACQLYLARNGATRL